MSLKCYDNTGLNKTAKENIAIRTNLQLDNGFNGFVDLIINQCPSHGTVIYDWAQMVGENKFFTTDYTSAQTNSLANTKAQILNGDQFDATIISTKVRNEDSLDSGYIGTGKNKDASVQSLVKKNGSNINVYGVIGKTNDYWNLDWNNTLTQNRVAMYAQGFEGDDKVSLFKSAKVKNAAGIDTYYNAFYSINSNGLQMKVDKIDPIGVQNYISDFTTISGVPVTSQKLADGQTQSIELVKSSNVRMR